MLKMKIVASKRLKDEIKTDREIISAETVKDWTNIAAVIVTDDELQIIDEAVSTKFGIPTFVATKNTDILNRHNRNIDHVIDLENGFDQNLYNREIEHHASVYESKVIPPFFQALEGAVERGSLQFETPGHHGGQYFRKHPAGRHFYDFFGENLFRADLSSAEVGLGDLHLHEGPALAAEKHAAKVYNADKTYFVTNGSTTSNNIAITAAISNGDLVLFDRNNHKSVYNSALVMNGGRPVYLETNRNAYGFIGGIYDSNFDELYIRAEVAKVDPERATWDRPFRLAVIQLGTYDGSIYNAQQVVERIGHLCDYILFDSAWVGYEQFIPMMKDSSPLLIPDLGPEDPGIFVIQSTHKGQAGLSQASQIHKKDKHIKGQRRYIDHKRMNHAYLKYSSTSPMYPLYASIDINARLQEGEAGQKLWHDLLVDLVDVRKRLIKEGKMVRPFIPPIVHGKAWEDASSEEIASDIDYWRFNPGEHWHGFDGYGEKQYFVDPNKLLLTTPGINIENNSYEDFGVPATIIYHFFQEHGIIPEKTDLNSLLFLMTPAENKTKLTNLVNLMLKFEQLVEEDVPLSEVLPGVYKEYKERYAGYTIRQLSQEMHDFYKANNTKDYQKKLFLHDYFPQQKLTPYEADQELLRNNAKLVPLSDIVGEVALEGGLPYPPGIFVIAPGEVWTKTAQKYFQILEMGINQFPGFAPEIQGVYFEENGGEMVAYGYVLDKSVKDEDDKDGK
jgi:ornithine decarboxylase